MTFSLHVVNQASVKFFQEAEIQRIFRIFKFSKLGTNREAEFYHDIFFPGTLPPLISFSLMERWNFDAIFMVYRPRTISPVLL